MFLGTLNDDNYSGPLISSSMVAGRKSKFEGNESASYAVPNNATVEVLSSIQIRFELVPKRWISWHVNVLGLIIGFVFTLASVFNKAVLIKKQLWKKTMDESG